MKIWEQYGLSKCAFRVYKSDLELFSISQVSRHWTLERISQCISISSPLAGMNLSGAVSHRRPCLLLLPEVHPAVGWPKIAWVTACLEFPWHLSQPLSACLWQQLRRTKPWNKTFQEHLILSISLHFLLPLWSGNPACGIQGRELRLVVGNKGSVIFT